MQKLKDNLIVNSFELINFWLRYQCYSTTKFYSSLKILLVEYYNYQNILTHDV